MSEKQTIVEQFPWAIEGSAAAIMEKARWDTYATVTEVKITRVSKTRITLEGGRQFYVGRYQRDALVEWGRESYRSGTLVPVDDPRIAQAKETQRKEQIRLDARKAAEQYAKDSHSEESARAAIEALQTFLQAWVP